MSFINKKKKQRREIDISSLKKMLIRTLKELTNVVIDVMNCDVNFWTLLFVTETHHHAIQKVTGAILTELMDEANRSVVSEFVLLGLTNF
ncbi:hypothetical protein HPG69_002045 [Diceros bicornis minor]|uniref:Uncharacterized protein n=1 Tax=Diceros bicornis minor TaxID=77932 RepID=A0A7J7FCH8_DICBM|nr:hypothetical protein HPG69_002045 [Diceros bicornis minor]